MRHAVRAAIAALALLGMVGATATLHGCAALGVRTAENTDERIVAGYKTVETVADLVGTLHAAGKISKADANAALDRADQGKRGIDAAVALRAAGDFSNAETRLAATIAALELLQTELRAKE